jgi:integrase
MERHRANGPLPAPRLEVVMQSHTTNRTKVAPGVYVRRGRFEIQWSQDGRVCWETLPAGTSKTAAIKAREGKRVDVDRGEAVAPSKVTLAEVADELFASMAHDMAVGRASERTLILYKQRFGRVRDTLGRRPIQKLRASEIEAFVRRLEAENLAPSTVRGHVMVLSAVCTFATKGDSPLLAFNPCRRLRRQPSGEPRKKGKRALSDTEIAALIEAAPESWRILLRVAAITGLRLSELLGLVWNEVDFNSEELHVTKQLSVGRRGKPAERVRPKSRNSVRKLPLFDAAKPLAARSLASSYSQPSDFVFCTRSGGPLSQRNAERAFEVAAERAGIEATFHDLRHSAISRWAGRVPAEVDAATVAAWAGDRLETILAHYVHPLAQDGKREQYRAVMAVGF